MSDVATLERVAFRYPGAAREALSGVSLAVAPGEIVVVAGQAVREGEPLIEFERGPFDAAAPSAAPRRCAAAWAGRPRTSSRGARRQARSAASAFAKSAGSWKA